MSFQIDTVNLPVVAYSNRCGVKAETDNMNIAFVIDRYLPHKGGGERYLEMLSQQLAKENHHVTILARRFPTAIPPHPRIHYHPIHVPPWPGWIRLLFFAFRCHQVSRDYRYDIVHDVGHTWGADVFNPHGGVEQVWLQRYFASYRHPFHRFLKKLQRLCSPKEWTFLLLQHRQYLSPATSRIIAISPMIMEHIRAHYPTLPAQKVVLVQNPADLSRFSPQNRAHFRKSTRAALGLDKNDVALLFAGNNFRLKGLFPLLEAMKLLSGHSPHLRLLVAGNESPQRWKRFCQRLGVESIVTFLGPVEKMEQLYAGMDIFVLPAYYDSAPLVILEALASGLPVITSRWAGTSSAIHTPDAGVILENNDDPVEIAKAIRSFLPDEKRQKAFQIAPQSVQSQTLTDHVRHILEIDSEIMKEKTYG